MTWCAAQRLSQAQRPWQTVITESESRLDLVEKSARIAKKKRLHQ